MNVAEYIANFLIKKNIKHVFGFQGSAIAKIVDSINASGQIEYIQNYHEQASAFCADAYSRVTGDIGVAIATSGPGATNLINGIANAHLDSIPCLFITGQASTESLKKSESVRISAFQEVDIVSMIKPITKYATTIIDESKIKYELEKAFYLAKSGRPGAVLLDIPLDIQFKEIDEKNLEGFAPEEEIYEIDKVEEVISLLKNSKRPAVLIGGGIKTAKAQHELKTFIKKTNMPVLATLHGLDGFDDAVGFSGIFGNNYANLTIQNADLVMVFGASLSENQIGKQFNNYAPMTKIIHVDIDKNELNRTLKEDISVYSDIKIFLTELNTKIANETLPNIQSWISQIDLWKQNYSKNTHLNCDEKIDPVCAIKQISKFFEDDTIITSDVGQNQMWVAQAIEIKGNQKLLNSGGLGSMGYSLPASIGAKTANPQAQVVAFSGDGGFQMNLQELQLISHKKINIKCIIFNNYTLGMIRGLQDKFYSSKYYGTSSEDFSCVNLELLANAYALEYLQITSMAQLPQIQKALSDEKPYIIDMHLNPDSVLLNKYDESKIYEENVIYD